MKITHQLTTRCKRFMTFGAVAMLPMVWAQESNVDSQSDGLESRFTVEEASEKKQEPQAKEPTSLNPEFAADLYQQLRKTEGNVFFSPYSISECVAMAYAGANGATASEMASAMHFEGEQQKLPKRLQLLRHHVAHAANQGEDKLNIANALCVVSAVPRQSYQTMVREHFEGELFSGELAEINGWVKQKTEGNIERILERLDPNSACVLLNAVYFKGSWLESFEKSATRERDFKVTAQKSVKVPMMVREGDYGVVHNDKHIAVELPYKTGCSMVLIMPAKAEDFSELEASLNETFVSETCNKLKGPKREILLSVPKFKIETKYDLAGPMKQLGMVKAFDQLGADFSGMYDLEKLGSGNNISIGQIKHKATFEVDEQGSVATAATAIETLSNSMPMPPELKITFDRPFLVMIRENTTNSTLFMGRISDPTK